MTDRIRTFTVFLDRDVREDDFEMIRTAVLMIKGVAAIEPQVVSAMDSIARMVVAAEIHGKILEAVSDVLHGKTPR